MMQRKTLFILSFLWGACALPQAQAEDYQLVPGQRAGFISATATEAAIGKQLPKDFVKRTFYREAATGATDGKLRCVSRIYPDSGKELWVIWKSDLKNSWTEKDLAKCQAALPFDTPSYVLLAVPENPQQAAETSPWKTQEGVRLEMDLAQLEAANGAAVTFSVQEETDGNIIGWNGGKLISVLNDALLSYDTLEAGERLHPYAESGNVSSAKLPADLKKQVRLVFFTVPLSK